MSEPVHGARCYACGYELRGNTSGTCPECGRSAPVILAIHDPEDFHRAKAALEQQGLMVRAVQPGGSIGTIAIVYGAARTGYIWVDQNHLERAEILLDEIGVTAHINTQRPIVDRSEPFCPKCNAELDLYGRPQCAECGTLFDWVEIDVPTIDPTHLTCMECGYELTGLNADRCPECNSPIDTVDRVVEAALNHASARERQVEMPQAAKSPWNRLFKFFATLSFVSALLAMFFFANQNTKDQALLALGVMLASLAGTLIFGAMVIVTRSNKPQR